MKRNRILLVATALVLAMLPSSSSAATPGVGQFKCDGAYSWPYGGLLGCFGTIHGSFQDGALDCVSSPCTFEMTSMGTTSIDCVLERPVLVSFMGDIRISNETTELSLPFEGFFTEAYELMIVTQGPSGTGRATVLNPSLIINSCAADRLVDIKMLGQIALDV